MVWRSRQDSDTVIDYVSLRSRSALPMTDTDDRLIAKAAISGLKSHPKIGYSTPAAMGIPRAL